ncbi:superoxide dismutase [Cu-Zn]-like [Scyliorhinus torazame]|uniref:superoxide dismutase [Cu-Zn]-like n=1 Tax=Scyliorhinus torazame TaxID=75743 RepID=UPI003B59A5D0
MIATGTCFMKGNEAQQDSGNSVRGTVTFKWDDTEEVFVKGTIEGLKPGKHGLYVCALGNITNGYISSGTHYNPCDKKHGGPEDTDRHVGDLGNIEANDDGVATFEMHDRLLRLAGNYSIIGRTLVVEEFRHVTQPYRDAGRIRRPAPQQNSLWAISEAKARTSAFSLVYSLGVS